MFMKGEHSDWAVEFLDPEPGAQRVAVLLELCLESLCSFKKPDCVQPQC